MLRNQKRIEANQTKILANQRRILGSAMSLNPTRRSSGASLSSRRDLDQVRDGPDEEQRVERRVDELHQPEDRFDGRDEERHERTAPTSVRTVVFGSVIMKKMKS